MKLFGLELKFHFDDPKDELQFKELIDEVNYKISFFVFPVPFCLFFTLGAYKRVKETRAISNEPIALYLDYFKKVSRSFWSVFGFKKLVKLFLVALH